MVRSGWALSAAVSLATLALGGQSAPCADVKVLNPMPAMILTGYSDVQKFSHPSALFVDKKRGDIWVADTGNHQIVEFDSQGVPEVKFRHMKVDAETGDAVPGEPSSVAVDSSGQVFVTDGSDKVAMYDYRGRLVKRINLPKLLGVERCQPVCLVVDGSDNLYIADAGGVRLIVLNRDQELVRTVSLKIAVKADAEAQKAAKDGPQNAQSISGIDIGSDGKIYVLNSSDYPCVRVLDSTGKEILAFGDVDAGWDNFIRPSAVAAVDDGTFWIADGSTNIVKQFAADGKYQQYIGGGPGTRPGEMRCPTSVATDGKDKLYVAEQGTNRIQVFLLKK